MLKLILTFILSVIPMQYLGAYEYKIPYYVGVETYSGRLTSYILTEAFKRADLKLTIPIYPLNRIEIMVAEGKMDGEIRTFEYGESRPYLFRVGKMGMHFSFNLYTTNKTLIGVPLEKIKERKLVIESLRGVKVCEEFWPKEFPNLEVNGNNSTDQALQKLLRRRIDLYCDFDLNVINSIHSLKLKPKSKNKIKLFHSIRNHVPLYLYLNKQHKGIAPKLEKTLKEMIEDGTVEKLRKKTVAELKI